MQRRTKDAPYGPGKLNIFGGWVEQGEAVYECLIREIQEETSLDTSKLIISPLTNFIIPASKDFDKERHFYLYQTNVEDMSFKIYEGDGAEAFSLDELKTRTDLTGSAEFSINNLNMMLSNTVLTLSNTVHQRLEH